MLGHVKLYLTDLFNCSTTGIRLLWNCNLWHENGGLKDDHTAAALKPHQLIMLVTGMKQGW